MLSDEAKRLWEDIKAKSKALAECAGPHEFVDTTPERALNKRFRCTKCGGEMSGIERRCYLQGLSHGRVTP
jgi:hypothetical protein